MPLLRSGASGAPVLEGTSTSVSKLLIGRGCGSETRLFDGSDGPSMNVMDRYPAS
jgi:hypothetical protein